MRLQVLSVAFGREARSTPTDAHKLVLFMRFSRYGLVPIPRAKETQCRIASLVVHRAPSSQSLNSNSTVALSVFVPVVSSLLGRLLGKMHWHKYFFLPFSLLDVPS